VSPWLTRSGDNAPSGWNSHEKGIAPGADYVEVDIQRTLDTHGSDERQIRQPDYRWNGKTGGAVTGWAVPGYQTTERAYWLYH
jgi:hypothetical protein